MLGPWRWVDVSDQLQVVLPCGGWGLVGALKVFLLVFGVLIVLPFLFLCFHLD